jgi:hypothetical protein
MNAQLLAFRLALVTLVCGAVSCPDRVLAQTSTESKKIAAIMTIQKIDGPYSYKSPADLIPVVGFVTEINGANATFRDCRGKISTVSFGDLTRIQRPCPPGSPVGPWVLDVAGKIVPLDSEAKEVKAYFGAEKAQIDPKDLPAKFQQVIKTAKPGDLVAVSYPAEGKLNFSIIGKPMTQ